MVKRMFASGWRWFFALAVLAVVCFFLYGYSTASDVGFQYNPNKTFRLNVPPYALNETQKTDLYNGTPICKLLPGNSGLKAGRMEVIVPYDPVTVFQIVSDIGHFHLTDPSYPSSGSVTMTRRTFMPYVFDGAHCEVNGSKYLYQLLVMPFVDPRKYVLIRHHDLTAFPWESQWESSQGLECADKGNPEMAEIAKNAVHITVNTGCWHIGPLPPEMRKTEQDKMRAYVVYFVDTNPGGDIAKIAPFVNKATSIAMPKLVNNIKFHAKSWRDHLKKYHSAQDLAQYDTWIAEYKKSVGAQ